MHAGQLHTPWPAKIRVLRKPGHAAGRAIDTCSDVVVVTYFLPQILTRSLRYCTAGTALKISHPDFAMSVISPKKLLGRVRARTCLAVAVSSSIHWLISAAEGRSRGLGLVQLTLINSAAMEIMQKATALILLSSYVRCTCRVTESDSQGMPSIPPGRLE